MSDRVGSFEEFWPYYVGAHRTRGCRGLHYFGMTGLMAADVIRLYGSAAPSADAPHLAPR